MRDNRRVEWIRRNMTTIGILVVFAMVLPFLMVLFGVVVF
jgi:preprotein translocase subunit SecE